MHVRNANSLHFLIKLAYETVSNKHQHLLRSYLPRVTPFLRSMISKETTWPHATLVPRVEPLDLASCPDHHRLDVRATKTLATPL